MKEYRCPSHRDMVLLARDMTYFNQQRHDEVGTYLAKQLFHTSRTTGVVFFLDQQFGGRCGDHMLYPTDQVFSCGDGQWVWGCARAQSAAKCLSHWRRSARPIIVVILASRNLGVEVIWWEVDYARYFWWIWRLSHRLINMFWVVSLALVMEVFMELTYFMGLNDDGSMGV